jgi:hypothetical protein
MIALPSLGAVLTAWTILNVVLSPLAEQVPPTTWYGKLLHVVVAVSPMDIMKAVRAAKGP